MGGHKAKTQRIRVKLSAHHSDILMGIVTGNSHHSLCLGELIPLLKMPVWSIQYGEECLRRILIIRIEDAEEILGELPLLVHHVIQDVVDLDPSNPLE